jgi:hypothetical protein
LRKPCLSSIRRKVAPRRRVVRNAGRVSNQEQRMYEVITCAHSAPRAIGMTKIPSPPPPRSLVHSDDSPLMEAVAESLKGRGFVRSHTHVYDRAGSRYRMVFAHLQRRINVEVCAPSHRRPSRSVRDVHRDWILRKHGWLVLRFQDDGAGGFTWQCSSPYSTFAAGVAALVHQQLTGS